MRQIEREDIPWMQYLLRKRYPKGYDPDTSARWMKEHVLPSPMMYLAIRTDDAFLVAVVNRLPWLPGDGEVNVASLCADEGAGWQPVYLLRRSIEWARLHKAKTWRIVSETDYDLGPLARRVGATAVSPRYLLEL